MSISFGKIFEFFIDYRVTRPSRKRCGSSGCRQTYDKIAYSKMYKQQKAICEILIVLCQW